MPDPTMQDMLQYWYTELSTEEIAGKLNITIGRIHRLRRKYALPQRERAPRSTGGNEYEPREEEIAAEMLKIRARWSDKEELSRRAVQPTKRWVPPVYSYDQTTGNFSESLD